MHPHSRVWLAEHKVLGTKRIIKGIPKNSPFHDRLVREAHLMKNLNSPFIPIIYDVDDDTDYTYIVEQFIEGESLGAILQRRLLSDKELFIFMIRISQIIKYLHGLPDRILYLDIKPDNIMIDGENVCLIDFGSAASSDCASDPVRSGTAGFNAPEQAGGGTLSERTDIYALGVLLKTLTAHSNISGKTASRLCKIADRAQSRAVWNRISTADIFIRMLEKVRDGEVVKRTAKSGRLSLRLQGSKIGILGLSHGTGVTTVVLAMAEFLKNAGMKNICVIEKNGNRDIESCMEHKGCRPDDETGMFVRGPVSYLTAAPGEQHIRALNRKYDCMIFDLGSDAADSISTMWLCDIRIVVGSAAPWRRGEYELLKRLKGMAGELKNWIVFVNLADNESLLDFKDYGAPILPVPMIRDPFRPSPDAAKTFEKAFKMIP